MQNRDGDTTVSDTADTIVDTDTYSQPANDPPTAPVVAIRPVAPGDDEDLTAIIEQESVDPESVPVDYTFAWSRNGDVRIDLTGSTVPAVETSEGDVWEVKVVPSDGAQDGPAGIARVTVGNLPPTPPSIHIEPAEPVARVALSLVVDTSAVDPEGGPLTTTIQWFENGVHYGSRDGLTTLPAAYVDGGDEFRVVVAVSDGVNAPVTTEATVAVVNVAPVVDHLAISPLNPTDDEDITAVVHGDDTDGAGEPTWRYVWYRDGVEAVDVGSADTVPASATSPGETWTLDAFLSDGHDEGMASAPDSAYVIPWAGYAKRQIFTATFAPDGAGGYAATTGEWAIEYLSYGSEYDNNDCALSWQVEAMESSRYCADCDFSFDATYRYDAGASTIEMGCARAQVDGTGYFFFNADSGQFTAYSTGPALEDRAVGLSFRVSRASYSYTYDGLTFNVASYRTSYTEDTAGNVELYVYYYQTNQVP